MCTKTVIYINFKQKLIKKTINNNPKQYYIIYSHFKKKIGLKKKYIAVFIPVAVCKIKFLMEKGKNEIN